MSPPQQATTSGRRASRPTPLSRKSMTTVPSKKSPLGKTLAKHNGKREEIACESDDEDVAGLPSFCGLCEKQIVSPGQLLYCSEQCRRKDQHKPISLSSPSPPQTPRSRLDSQQDILPLRSPTVMRPPSIAFSDDSVEDGRPHHDSDTETEQNHDRHRYSMPSLSHTPSSYISSSSYMSTSTRPLAMRRSDPFSASFSSLSVDLVVPVINVENAPSSFKSCSSTKTLSYEKQAVGSSPGTGSLKQLFSHTAMKAPPKQDRPSSG